MSIVRHNDCMIYVTESDYRSKDLYAPYYYLQSDSIEQLQKFRRQIAALVSTEISRNPSSESEAWVLMEDVVSDGKAISGPASNIFLKLVMEAPELIRARQERLIRSAVRGLVSAAVLVEEFQDLDEYDGGILSSPHVAYVTQGGLDATPDFDKSSGNRFLRPEFYSDIISACGEDSLQASVAGQMGLTHFAHAYELEHKPSRTLVKPDSEHYVLGTLEADTFEPAMAVY